MPAIKHNSEHTEGPLVSFILTTYNLPVESISKCIDSIMKLSLSRQEREIILVDDGSDISPIEDLTKYASAVIYVRQSNQGLSVARNIGLRVASGEYVQFIDADDWLITAPYEHCLDIARYHTPDLVFFDITEKEHPGIPFTFDGPVNGSTYMHDHNLHASACGYLFRRSCLGSLHFTPGILHEDEEFTPQLLLRCERIFTTTAEAYHYFKRSGSIMHSTDRRHKLHRMTSTEQVIFHLHEIAATLPYAERMALNRRVAQLSMDYLYQVIHLTHSQHHLSEAIAHLREKGLYPLPDEKYTRKYNLFRKAINNRLGRLALIAAIR